MRQLRLYLAAVERAEARERLHRIGEIQVAFGGGKEGRELMRTLRQQAGLELRPGEDSSGSA